ncbi:UbiH/UbiF family hydroxylase [Rhizobium sp. RU20A]|uniref:UbiH/UbiF family hydroxylase n=1 Tax=Rhizobium sp. RU20A TaxID=1907412 RepID=UPI00122CE512|nr:UbiH/UbiF family hydroxylase [Rhizobium sp. RU20A]
MDSHDVAVVGAGLAGALSALALAREGLSVAFIGRTPQQADGRTTALVDPSIAILESLHLWEAIRPKSAPLAAIRIIDGTKRLLRAPTVTFRSVDVGLPAFGYNIPNAHLNTVLSDAIAAQPAITRVDAMLETVTEADGTARLLLDDGRALTARLVVAADGRKSVARAAAGIDVKTWTYPQTALVLNFSHLLPHDSISNEFHTEAGPFTQVPLPGNRSSLVWVQQPTDAADRAELNLEALSLVVEKRMQSMLGAVTVEPGVQRFDLSGMRAHRFGAGRTVLIGEAGHAFPPIGAQGLNLSLRDVSVLTDLIRDGGLAQTDLAGRYDRRRRLDVASRTASVDLLNRSLLSDFLPVQVLRAAGLHLLSIAGPLRGAVMREGIEPGSALKASGAALWEKIGLREKVGRKSA